MANLLEVLIQASEKAANIARSCCSSSDGQTLCIAEKNENEANIRFDKDFKTIADVLAQESAKALIETYFPELTGHVRGEECAEIEGVSIKLQESYEKTEELLSTLVPQTAAKNLAKAAHGDVSYCINENCLDIPVINMADIGIWIDPIDGTAEFIAGVCGKAKPGQGLPCVTVLIGAYKRSSGEPIIGVINQPFYNDGKGKIIWGFHNNETKICSISNKDGAQDKVVLISAAEKLDIIENFKTAGWTVKSFPGAGNKLMKVASGEASAYIVTQGTTFRWDTCAPHAILLSKGGDVLSCKTHLSLTYNDEKDLPTQEYCNMDGIIAYSDEAVLNELISVLSFNL